MKNSNLSPHDRFFKKSMADPKAAKAFFKEYLPAEIREQVNLDTLSLSNESHIDENMRMHVVDLLYLVKFGKEQGYIYLLCEHLSTPKPTIVFQLVKYIIRIMEDHLTHNNTNKLPIVYPLILYNGEPRYNHTTSFLELFGENRKFAEAIIMNPFKLGDVRDIPSEVTKANLRLSIMVKALKHYMDKDIMDLKAELIPELVMIDKQGDVAYIKFVIKYILETRKVGDKQKFFNLIKNELSEKAGEKMITIADSLRQEGRQEVRKEAMALIDQARMQALEEGEVRGEARGEVRGKEEGKMEALRDMVLHMRAKGMEVAQIANLLDLLPEEIEKLKSHHDDTHR